MFDSAQIEQIRKIVDEMVRKQPRFKVLQSDIPPGTVKRRHLEDVPIVFGVLADRPADGEAVGIRSYFSTDNNTLAMWNGTAWVEEVFT